MTHFMPLLFEVWTCFHYPPYMRIFPYILVVIFLFASCGTLSEDEFLAWRVAASSEEVAQAVRPIVGDRGLVLVLRPAHIPSASYTYDQNNVTALANAEIIFYDSGSDPWVEDLLAESARLQEEGVEVIMEGTLSIPYQDFPAIDLRGSEYARVIERALSDFDPAGEGYYERAL